MREFVSKREGGKVLHRAPLHMHSAEKIDLYGRRRRGREGEGTRRERERETLCLHKTLEILINFTIFLSNIDELFAPKEFDYREFSLSLSPAPLSIPPFVLLEFSKGLRYLLYVDGISDIFYFFFT